MAANLNAEADAAARMVSPKQAFQAAPAADGMKDVRDRNQNRPPLAPGQNQNQNQKKDQRKDQNQNQNQNQKKDQDQKNGLGQGAPRLPFPAAPAPQQAAIQLPKAVIPPPLVAKPLNIDNAPVPDFGDNVEKEMDNRISSYFTNLTTKTRRYKDEIKTLRSQVKNMKDLMGRLALGYKVSVEAVVQVSTLIRHYQELIDGIQIMFEDLDKTPLIQPADFNEIKKLTDMNMVRIQKQFRDQVKQIAELYQKTGNQQAAQDIMAFDRDISTLSISAQQLITPGQPYGQVAAPGLGPAVALAPVLPARGGGGGGSATMGRQHVYVRGPHGMLRIAASFKRRFQVFAMKTKNQNKKKSSSA